MQNQIGLHTYLDVLYIPRMYVDDKNAERSIDQKHCIDNIYSPTSKIEAMHD